MAVPDLTAGMPDAALGQWLRTLLGRDVPHVELYRSALTHRSARHDNNERLEFLGDAVLGMVIAEELFRRFPEADEGDLSRLRSRLVSAGPLAIVGAQIGIGPMLHLGSGELRTGGFRRESILADATEALFAALYLDAGLEAVRTLILRLFAAQLSALTPAAELKDAKTRLQELLQARGEALPIYSLESAVGDPHEQVFSVQCEAQLSDAVQLRAHGAGSSRRRAEQEAASGVLEQLTRRWHP